MEFIIGSREEFYDFLNSVSKEDRVAIISHNDLDGFGSALVMEEMLIQKGVKPVIISFFKYLNAFERISEQLRRKRVNKVFLFDISETSDSEGFKKLRENFDVFYIDHHPSDIKEKNIIKAETTDCVTFILYKLGEKEFNLDELKLLVCATMISEFSYKSEDNFNFLKENYSEVDKQNILNSVPGKIAQLVSLGLTYFDGKEEKVYEMIKKNDLKKLEKYANIVEEELEELKKKYKKEAEYYRDKRLYFYYGNPKFRIASAVITSLSVDEDKTFIFASDSREEEGIIKVSARNQTGKENMIELMKKLTKGFENATVGGHVPAAGGTFMKKDLEKFKQNILS